MSIVVDRVVGRTKIVKTPHEQEWQIKVWDQHGERWPEADCFESSPEAARQTEAAMKRQ